MRGRGTEFAPFGARKERNEFRSEVGDTQRAVNRRWLLYCIAEIPVQVGSRRGASLPRQGCHMYNRDHAEICVEWHPGSLYAQRGRLDACYDYAS